MVELKGYDPDYMKNMEEFIKENTSFNSLDEYFKTIYDGLKDYF